MTEIPTQNMTAFVGAFRDAQWKTRWLVIGLIVLLLWRSIGLVDRVWLSRFPSLVLVLTGLAFQVFLLVFPVITRNPHKRETFGSIGLIHCLVEFCIAIPTVIVTIILLAVANYVVSRISPGSSLTPDYVEGISRSPNRILVYLILLFSFTFAPIAEELFFRGFLYNAFRARMPLFVASVTQCIIFGFAHTFGVTHAAVACILGVLLTAIYEWRKTLVTPILVHAGINFVAALGVILMMAASANDPVLGILGDPKDTECVIHGIVPESAAEKADLRVGDVVLSFNGEPVRDLPHLAKILRRFRPGDSVPIAIRRNEESVEVTVVLRPRAKP